MSAEAAPLEHAGTRRLSRTTMWVVGICWATIIFDGYDLIVYGAVVPTLLEYEAWGLNPKEAGAIGSYALVGMLVGALIAGTITDLVGRRRIILFCLCWFSVFMGVAAIAPSPEVFGFARFMTGLGLGGVLPTASALTLEYAPASKRNLTYAMMFSGYSIGGILAAALAIPLVAEFGWRVMFVIGLVPIFVIVPLAWKFMPESISFLIARGRRREAIELARRYDVPLEPEADASSPEVVGEPERGEDGRLASVAGLFRRNIVVATLLFWAISFLGLLLIYGINTWLPQIMKNSGYSLGSALSFLLVLNVGAIAGALLAGRLADRFGAKRATTVGFTLGAVAIFLLSLQPPLIATYLLLTVAGLGSIGTMIVVNAYVMEHYAVRSRATALGWALGVGRAGAICGPLVGGFILSSKLGVEANFFVFALAGIAAAALCSIVPTSPIRRAAAEHASRMGRAAGRRHTAPRVASHH